MICYKQIQSVDLSWVDDHGLTKGIEHRIRMKVYQEQSLRSLWILNGVIPTLQVFTLDWVYGIGKIHRSHRQVYNALGLTCWNMQGQILTEPLA